MDDPSSPALRNGCFTSHIQRYIIAVYDQIQGTVSVGHSILLPHELFSGFANRSLVSILQSRRSRTGQRPVNWCDKRRPC